MGPKTEKDFLPKVSREKRGTVSNFEQNKIASVMYKCCLSGATPTSVFCFCFVCFFCVPQLYLWGSPLLGDIFAYVTVF